MKILVVDDEKDVSSLFEQRFRREIKNGSFEFKFTYSGEEALDYISKFKNGALLILSDINMPGMSGLELLKYIRQGQLHPPPKVVMITAYGDTENYSRAIQLGADDFITKPIDFSLLKDKIINQY